MDIIDHAVLLCCECDECIDVVVDSFIFESYKAYFNTVVLCFTDIRSKIKMELTFLAYMKMRVRHRHFFTDKFKIKTQDKLDDWITQGRESLIKNRKRRVNKNV